MTMLGNTMVELSQLCSKMMQFYSLQSWCLLTSITLMPSSYAGSNVFSAQENNHYFQTKHACDLQSLNQTHMWVWLWVWLITPLLYENPASSPGLADVFKVSVLGQPFKKGRVSILHVYCHQALAEFHDVISLKSVR